MTKAVGHESDNSFVMVEVIAGCVVRRDGKYLLVQEKQESAYKLWNLPAGHVDEGETFEQAAIRETKEESGFVVKIIKKLPVSHDSVNSPVKHAYHARIVGGNLHFPKEELLDAKWFALEDVKKLKDEHKLRADWVFDSIAAVEDDR